MKNMYVLSMEDIEGVRRGEYSPAVVEYVKECMAKPSSNPVKLEAMRMMREKYHMTNMEIAKVCHVSHNTVMRHLGKQDKSFTSLSMQKVAKKKTINAEYKWEQEFNALQDERKNNPHAHTVLCEMCGRKFYGLQKKARFCGPCVHRRMNMISAKGLTAAQIDEQIANRKKAEQILNLFRQAADIAGTITDSNVLMFPTK